MVVVEPGPQPEGKESDNVHRHFNYHCHSKDPAARDRQLEEAISLLREKALGHGILVTRVDYTTFSIALSPEVAYGQTREVDLL
jgi:hypothetical protein